MAVKLTRVGHVHLRVADQERSKRFYRDVLGFQVAEEDPEHGGVSLTLGQDFHTLDLSPHPEPEQAQKPRRDQIGVFHIAFQVGSHTDLRAAYVALLEHGVLIDHATEHVNQRSIYFQDPDGNRLEIYYELPHSLQLFANGRGDDDRALAVSAPAEPLPAWLLEDWPGPATRARLSGVTAAGRHQTSPERDV